MTDPSPSAIFLERRILSHTIRRCAGEAARKFGTVLLSVCIYCMYIEWGWMKLQFLSPIMSFSPFNLSVNKLRFYWTLLSIGNVQNTAPRNYSMNVNKLVRKEKTTIVASMHIDFRRNRRTASKLSPPPRNGLHIDRRALCWEGGERGSKKRQKCLVNRKLGVSLPCGIILPRRPPPVDQFVCLSLKMLYYDDSNIVVPCLTHPSSIIHHPSSIHPTTPLRTGSK